MKYELPLIQPVVSDLPAELGDLTELAFNLYWSWNEPVQELFEMINPRLWSETRNPVEILRSQNDWSKLTGNDSFMQQYKSCSEEFKAYMAKPSDQNLSHIGFSNPENPGDLVTYFCAEFGLHESFQIYSGGLGILAGDHVKTASDLGMNFVGVGLFYRHGYFRQNIDGRGMQQHAYPAFDYNKTPMFAVADSEGKPLKLSLKIKGRDVHFAVWAVKVGTVNLLLMDTDTVENPAEIRKITAQLYTSGREMRLYQELLLGIGGVKILNALGIEPKVWHLNEGHSAFMLLERLDQAMKAGESFDQAKESITAKTVFTIHTPVPAGNEKFDVNMCHALMADYFEAASVDRNQIFELGRGLDGDHLFDLTAMCLRMSRKTNGVSLLHGRTAADTWKDISLSPVCGLTNGVHLGSWLGPEFKSLIRRKREAAERTLQYDEFIAGLSDKEIWQAHLSHKKSFCEYLKARQVNMLSRHGFSPDRIASITETFTPDVFIIGFARRFATYKRATLFFRDMNRVEKLLTNSDKPVMIVFSGKAHPADEPGQDLIRQVYQYSLDERFLGKIHFIEDYNMMTGRMLVQGTDLWLNNPRRPMEASGTSGMKTAMNGVPNLSILDGWWDEGFKQTNGWAIGNDEYQDSDENQDNFDAHSLYETLEHDIVEKYYARNEEAISSEWVKVMRSSIEHSLYQFSTFRMLSEYQKEMYY